MKIQDGSVADLAAVFTGDCTGDCKTCPYSADADCANFMAAEEAIKQGWRKIVKCRDCKHCTFDEPNHRYRCDVNGFFSVTVDKNGFCHKGEKRKVDLNG